MKIKHIKHCEACGAKLVVVLGPHKFNVKTGEKEFEGSYRCPKYQKIFGIISNEHSDFRGAYSGMGEFFQPFIFNSKKKLIGIGDVRE